MDYDVIVIGAGPAGSVASMYLAKAKKKVLLVDKASFPRDKICGDAQGRKAASILRELGIYEGYEKLEGQKIYGITLSSPNGTLVHLDVESRDKPAPGYVHRRLVLDNYLFRCAEKVAETKTLEVEDLIIEKGFVKGVVGKNSNGQKEEHRAKIVLAADGANSITARKFGLNKNPPEHFIVGIRCYYDNVKGMTDRIELHLIKRLLPGYLWIFPMGGGKANVGLGMIVKDMNEKKVNLKEALLKEIKENPLFAERFKDAHPLEDIKGWNLPIASYRRKCFGNGFLLLGDAASLIDPLSGEGVGNAMISSRIAANVVVEASRKNDSSEGFLKMYETLLWETIGQEIKADYRLQVLGKKFPFMIDRLIVKVAKDEKFRQKVEQLLPYTGGRKEIGSEEFLTNLAEKKEVEKMLAEAP